MAQPELTDYFNMSPVLFFRVYLLAIYFYKKTIKIKLLVNMRTVHLEIRLPNCVWVWASSPSAVPLNRLAIFESGFKVKLLRSTTNKNII